MRSTAALLTPAVTVTRVLAGCYWWWACQDLNLGPHPYQGSAPGPVSAGSRLQPARTTYRWRPLETAANRSAPMACGPNVDQARPAYGSSDAPRCGLAWQGGARQSAQAVHEPVRACQLVSWTVALRRMWSSTRYDANYGPMVIYGREESVAALARSRAPVTLVTGDSGVGKSELLAAAQQAAEDALAPA